MGTWKVLGYGLCKVAGVCGRVKCVESCGGGVRGKFEGMGVESARKVGGCEQKEGWVRWYYRDR